MGYRFEDISDKNMIILFPGGTGAGKALEYFEQNFITRCKSEKPSVFGSNLFMVFVFLIYNPHSFRCSQPNISFNRFNNLFSFVTVKTLSFHWIIALRGFLRSSPSFFFGDGFDIGEHVDVALIKYPCQTFPKPKTLIAKVFMENNHRKVWNDASALH